MKMWVLFLVTITLLGLSSGNFENVASYKFFQTINVSDQRLKTTYQIRASALIEKVHKELLHVKLNDLQLYVPSKKLTSGTYKLTKSSLDSIENYGFFISFKKGIIDGIYVAESEDHHIINIKRSLSSLLQFQENAGENSENDVNGKCKVKYEVSNSLIKKTKYECLTSLPNAKDDVWGGSVIPQRVTDINLVGGKIKSIKFKEDYNINLSLADFMNSKVSTEISLELDKELKPSIIQNEEIKVILSKASKELGKEYIYYNLLPEDILSPTDEEPLKELATVIKENIKSLKSKELGTVKSALGALKVIRAMKKSSFNDIYNALTSKAGKKVIAELLDILGGIQTLDGHKAAMKFLNMESKEHNLDLCERYLWALSTSTHHKKAVILDLLSLTKNEIDDSKLLETLMQTISSMVRKSADESGEEFIEKTVNLIGDKLKKCNKTDEICQRIYLKALTNIRSPKSLSLLIDYVLKGSRSIGVRAMKAIQSLGKNNWNEEVFKLAERVYLSNGTYDSSSKVIALDILLDYNKPSYTKLVQLLKQKHASRELKEYLLQRLVQVSEGKEETKQLIKTLLLNEGLHNYDIFAQGGLSTAFNRPFMSNGFLSTAQEVKSGLLKQGYVNVNLQKNGVPKTIFTLGLFSNGLNSFVSSEEGEEDEEENVETSAGLELTVLGVEFRPFIFFEGQGELMGHVFSGAGSTLTPAYQALLLLKDEVSYIPLGTGELMLIGFTTVASVDLSGKIEISLWSRAAESLVQNRAGLFTEELIKINSPFIKSQMKMELTAEPQLKLTSDIQFSSKVALCLQLEQPESVVQYNTTTLTKVPGFVYRNKKFINRRLVIPGRSYALNSKNNEMCKILYSQ